MKPSNLLDLFAALCIATLVFAPSAEARHSGDKHCRNGRIMDPGTMRCKLPYHAKLHKLMKRY